MITAVFSENETTARIVAAQMRQRQREHVEQTFLSVVGQAFLPVVERGEREYCISKYC
jgi:hypothetical protein